MSDEKILVELCPNHFQNLANGTPCDKCPSRLENKDTVRKASEALLASGTATEIIVKEMQSIRSAQDALKRMVVKIDAAVHGNGQGLRTKVAILESRHQLTGRMLPIVVSIISSIVAMLMGLFAMIKG